ncbi:MAG: sigma-70 domain-containing protein [Polyangiaceae bacterium]
MRLDFVVQQLLETTGDEAISLDVLADALAPHDASPDEIDAVIDALERAGRVVGELNPSVREDLLRVLPAARALKQSAGRGPTLDEIATETDLSVQRVRAALLFGRVLSRGARAR